MCDFGNSFDRDFEILNLINFFRSFVRGEYFQSSFFTPGYPFCKKLLIYLFLNSRSVSLVLKFFINVSKQFFILE